jgi:hypothetical protein
LFFQVDLRNVRIEGGGRAGNDVNGVNLS